MTLNMPIAAQARGADLTPESAGAVVYPQDGTVSPFTVINLGSGKVKMGDAVHDGRLPALWFGKDGQGIGAEEVMNRLAGAGETLAVVTFSTVESLDVLAEVVQRIRGIAFPNAAAPAAATAPRMVPTAPDEGMTNQQLQELKVAAQRLAADGCNWSIDVGCMFVLAMIERIESLAAAPAPGPQFQEDPMDIIRTLLCVVDRYWALPDEKRELYPSPTSECSPLMIAARRACVERGYTAGGLSIAAADGKAGAA